MAPYVIFLGRNSISAGAMPQTPLGKLIDPVAIFKRAYF